MTAIKVDGPTKEEYVWGFRTGMITFGVQATYSTEALYAALEKKVAGAIRSAISNCSHPAQSILAKAMASGALEGEQQGGREALRERAAAAQQLASDPQYADLWEAYPFNAGYFMCLRLRALDADTFRKHALTRYGVGVIADGKHDIRVAFSAVDVGNLADLYAQLAAAARDLLKESAG